MVFYSIVYVYKSFTTTLDMYGFDNEKYTCMLFT